ncbi:MAG: hypothetical protein R3E96_13290 [Planctomycetota bacterium]
MAGKNPRPGAPASRRSGGAPRDRQGVVRQGAAHRRLSAYRDGYGGSFVYGIAEDKLALGFVVGLDHADAKLDPHALFVQWKQHPRIRPPSPKAARRAGSTAPKPCPEGGY